ncbi:unknown [Clostridium sp. CAG:967]|nr:unknown [Clostridium sp. CAG:967]
MFENNVNNKQKLQFQAMSPGQAQGQPVPMQAVNPELLKENIQDSYVANRVAESTDDPKTMLITAGVAVPTWYAISQGMDHYAKKSRGEFEQTLHHKVGQFGDDVTGYVKNSRFGKSGFAKSVNSGFKNFKGFLKRNFVDRFRITRAMASTPSLPELDMVKGQANGMTGMQLFDYPQQVEQFVKPLKHLEDLDCYGASKDIAKDPIYTKYKALLDNATTPQARVDIMQKAEFEALATHTNKAKLNDKQIQNALKRFEALTPEKRALTLKNMKAREWGYKSFKELEGVLKNIQENMPRVLEASHNANKNMFVRIWGTNANARGRASKHLFGREVYASETANKLAGSLGNVDLSKNPQLEKVLKDTGLINKIPKSALGKFLAKYNNLIMEGATNRVAGGKFVAIMQAAYLADVIVKSMKQEGAGEKAKAFAERFTEMVAFFVCMPLAIQLMHKVGGLQYAGMTPDQVKAYRANLNAHNEKAMAGKFANKADWKASKDALKTELNAGVKNPITKLFKRIGRIVSVGLEQIRPFDNKAVSRVGWKEKIIDLFRHPKFGMKQMAGYPMRIILGMMIILPFLSKIAVKGSHMIFGKPKNSLLDEGKEKAPETVQQPQQTQIPPQLQQQMQAQTPAQQTVTQQTTTVTSSNQQQTAQSSSNLLNKYRSPQQTTSTTTTTTAKTVNDEPAKAQEPVRTYIPSPEGVKINNSEDTSSADAALRRADLAEQKALETLGMRW